MDNLNQEKKPIVNPLRRQILIGGATTPLVLTLFARNASAVEISRGGAPYSAVVKGSRILDGGTVESDSSNSELYEKLKNPENTGPNGKVLQDYYGVPGTGEISEESRSIEGSSDSYYVYTCTWTFRAPGAGPSTAGNFARRYERDKISGNGIGETPGDITTDALVYTYQKKYQATNLPVSVDNIDSFVAGIKEILALDEYVP